MKKSQQFSERPSPWVFNPTALTLEFHKGTHPEPVYYVDLERCGTPVQVLDWIMHIQGKLWATDEVLAGLVRSLWECLGPEICFGAARGKPINVRSIIRKQMQSPCALREGPLRKAKQKRRKAT